MDGRFRVFPMTDASLQCRYRKVVEFCPASGVSAEMQKELAARTRKLAEHCGYVGVGTLEYLVDASRAYLVEGSARLNTGFHLWERVAGTSAVSWQLSALEGGAPGDEPSREPRKEWAEGLALRLYAEDSLLQLPQPGVVREVTEKREWRFTNPALPAEAELDLQVSEGTRIESTDYGMVGMLWVGAGERKQMLSFARGVLDELWIAGSIQTNERFLGELLAHPWVQEGIFHAGFVDEEFLPSVRPPAEIFKALQFVASEAAANLEIPAGSTVHWAVGDQIIKAELEGRGAVQPRWRKGPRALGKRRPAGLLRLGCACGWPRAQDLRFSARPGQVAGPAGLLGAARPAHPQVAKRHKPKRAPRLLALVQGRIHAVLYREGTLVPAHEPLLVLDSLGQLVPHAVPVDVRIVSWRKGAEESVQAGEELAELEIVSKG